MDRRSLTKYGEVTMKESGHAPMSCNIADCWLCEQDNQEWDRMLESPEGRVLLERLEGEALEEIAKRERGKELDLITSVAYDVIARVMKEGARKYAPGHWEGVSEKEHWTHAYDHVYDGQWGECDIEDMEHAIVRLLFIVAKQKEGK